MHYYTPALRAILTKYRKRKHSLKGPIQYFVLGPPSVNSTRRSQQSSTCETHPLELKTIYDARAEYDWQEPDYMPPDPWFEGHQQPTGTSMIVGAKPFVPRANHMEPVQYDDSVMMLELIDKLVQRIEEQSIPLGAVKEAIEDLKPLIGAEAEALKPDMMTEPNAEQADAFELMQSAFNQQLEQAIDPQVLNLALEMAACLGPEQFAPENGMQPEEVADPQTSQSLDDIVQDLMPEQPGPYGPYNPAMQDPYMMQFFNQQMQPLMNPFMMPFSPGPGM